MQPQPVNHTNARLSHHQIAESNFSTVISQPLLRQLSDLLDAWQSDAQAAFDAKVNKLPRGPISGWPRLDQQIGGCFSQGVHIVHGQPGTGKTAFALQIAANCGCPCLFVSCERSALELLRRHTARVTGTYLGRFKSGDIPPAESLRLVRRACAQAPMLALVDATQAHASVQYLRDAALIAKGNERHLLIIIDSVHSWAEGSNIGATEYEMLNAALQGLRNLAHQLDCPILAVSERNREAMRTGGMSAGAGTRKLEYSAETVIDLSRKKEDAREDFAGQVEIAVKLAKNRHGAAGRDLGFRFHGAKQEFSEDSATG